MRIHAPAVTRTPEHVRVAARVTSDADPRLNDELFFEFPAGALVTDRPEPFVAAALQYAMAAGETLHVEGPLSPRIHAALERVQTYFAEAFPNVFARIEVRADRYEPTPPATHGAPESASFSGGVDSFYTFVKMRPQRLVFIHGFDIGLQLASEYARAAEAYQRTAEQTGRELVTCRTNIRETRLANGTPWDYTHGSALAAVALCLGPQTPVFYIPSTHTTNAGIKWGSNRITDPLFSTESTEIRHHEDGATRTAKTVAIADCEATYDALRICWVVTDGVNNCGKCAKCVRTMLTLQIIDRFDRYATFPRTAVSTENWDLKSPGGIMYAREVADLARAHGRFDIAAQAEAAMQRSVEIQAAANRVADTLGIRNYHARNYIKHGIFRLARLLPKKKTPSI